MLKPDRIVSTTCPYCGVGCNLQLHVKDDTIFKVTSPFDAVVNQGNLCVKGRFGYDYIYHPKRVTKPMVRRYLLEGKTGTVNRDSEFVDRGKVTIPDSQLPNHDGDWIPVDWNTALDLTASKLTEIYHRDGSDAMSVYCCAKEIGRAHV